jgi:hypothetical protein
MTTGKSTFTETEWNSRMVDIVDDFVEEDSDSSSDSPEEVHDLDDEQSMWSSDSLLFNGKIRGE